MTRSTGKYRKRLPPLADEELALYRADPNREKTVVHGFPQVVGITDWVVCRECGCRLTYVSTGHLRSHGLMAKTYGEKWPETPLYSPAAKTTRLKIQRNWVSRQDPDDLAKSKHDHYLAHKTEYIDAASQWNIDHSREHKRYQATYRQKPEAKEMAKERKAKHLAKINQKLWRPDDWSKWKAEDIMVGTLLIENPGMTNNQIGQRLDESRRLECPFGEDSWERALTIPGTGANWIAGLRNKVKRPARR